MISFSLTLILKLIPVASTGTTRVTVDKVPGRSVPTTFKKRLRNRGASAIRISNGNALATAVGCSAKIIAIGSFGNTIHARSLTTMITGTTGRLRGVPTRRHRRLVGETRLEVAPRSMYPCLIATVKFNRSTT